MKKITTVSLSSIYLFILSSPVRAQEIIISPPPQVKILNLGKLIGGAVGAFLIVAAIAALFYLLWGGFRWITSGGDKSAVEEAQNRIQAALLGLLIIFAVWALFAVVGQWLGLDIFNLKLPQITGG